MNFFSHLLKMDTILAGAVVLLTLFGIVELVAMAQNSESMVLLQYKQMIALALGIAVMVAVSLFDYRFFKNNSYAVILLWAGTLLLLLLVLIVGGRTRGSVSWFKIGEVAFAPVEVTKVALVLLLAKYFSLRHIEMYRLFHLITSFVYVAAPASLVLLQPDLGSAMVMFILWIVIMLFAGISKKQLLALAIGGAATAWIGWGYLLKAYQKERIISFLNPYSDPQGVGYNVIQSLIAVGDGGVWGKGLGYGSQVQLGFLPEAHTDFMFASVAEEFGLVGVSFIFLLLGIIVWRMMRIALHAENNFARLCSIGMSALIFIQVGINMGMSVGVVPIIGITFPFLSYGGSSLLALFMGLGLVQSIKVRSG